MVRVRILSVLLSCSFAVSASVADNIRGHLAIERGHQFQGVDQSQSSSTKHAGLEYQLGENFTTGIWLGEFVPPLGLDRSKEIDYFIGYKESLSFSQSLYASIWRYTYTDRQLDSYDWTQLLLGYEYESWFNLTIAVAENFSRSNQTTTFAEATFIHNLGRFTTSLSIGRNNLSRTDWDSFSYVQVKGVYQWKAWHLFANYTRSQNTRDRFVDLIAAKGFGAGLMYTF